MKEKIKSKVDETCTFWNKGQCDRPYKEKNACEKCKNEVINFKGKNETEKEI